jgi:hypothetical protein
VAKKGRFDLKDIFRTGNIPTGNDFRDFIDSVWNLEDDGDGIAGPTGPTGPAGNKTGYYSIGFKHDSLNPSSSTTYYIGDIGDIGTSSDDKYRKLSLVDGIVTKVYYHYNLTSDGSSEPSGLYLRNINTGTTEPLTTSETFTVFSDLNIYTLGSPLAVSVGDSLEIIWQTPSWSSPPLGVSGKFEALVEY